MDWDRAKVLMLYIFLVLDICLAFLLWRQHRLQPDDFSAADLLADEDIHLDCAIPGPVHADGVILEYTLYTEAQIQALFFQDPVVQKKSEDLITAVEGYKKVILINRKLLRYEDTPPEPAQKINTLEAARNAAMDFLRRKGFADDLVEVHAAFQYDTYSLQFAQVDRRSGLILDTSFTNIQLNQNGVISMERQVFNTPRKTEGELELPDPARKLLRLFEFPEARGKTIVKIEPCYFFDPAKNPYIDNPDKTAGGRAVLALRVTLADGIVLHID